jgi:hypothetical protein
MTTRKFNKAIRFAASLGCAMGIDLWCFDSMAHWPSSRMRRRRNLMMMRQHQPQFQPTSARRSPISPNLLFLSLLLILFAALIDGFSVSREGVHQQLTFPKASESELSRKLPFLQTRLRMVGGEAIVNGHHETETADDSTTLPFGDVELVDDLLANSTLFKSSTVASSLLQPEKAAPALSFTKFLTMQDKRVVVTIRYTEEAGLRPFFLTVAKKVKAMHPDVVLERRGLVRALYPGGSSSSNNNIVSSNSIGNSGDGGSSDKSLSSTSSSSSSGSLKGSSATDAATFEILVDGKPVLVVSSGGKNKGSSTSGSANTPKKGGGMTDTIFISMTELSHAIERARRRRRPSTAYGGNGASNSGRGSLATGVRPRRT